jgi:hypothetical protein
MRDEPRYAEAQSPNGVGIDSKESPEVRHHGSELACCYAMPHSDLRDALFARGMSSKAIALRLGGLGLGARHAYKPAQKVFEIGH